MATAKKAAKKSAKKAPAKKAAANGSEIITLTIPSRVANKFRAQAARMKRAGTNSGDGRWGYGSLMRETLESAASKLRA